MTERNHRRAKRRRGVRLAAGSGRRRASGVVADEPLSRAEVAERAFRARRWASRRRIFAALAVAIVIIAGTVLTTSLLRSDGTSEEPAIFEVEPVPESGASIVMAVVGEDRTARSIVLVAAAEGATSRIVLFPPSLLATLPGFGENTLTNTTRFDGIGLLDLTISNLLGVRVDGVVELDAAAVEGIFTDGLEVTLADPLVEPEGDAQVVVIGAGTAVRTPSQLARLLVDRGGDDELTWLQRQGAVWRALFDAAAGDPAIVEAVAATGASSAQTIRNVLTSAAENAVVTAIPATRIEPTGGEERYQLSGEVAVEFAADSIPYLIAAEEPRFRVEVLNGNGEIGSTRPVAATLIRRGFRIILTDNADRLDYDTTRIIAHGREHQAAALEVREIIGRGDVSVEVLQPSGVVDVTIIVARDLVANGG